MRNFRGLHDFGWRFGRYFGSGFRLCGVFTTVEKFGLSRLCFSLSLNRLWLSGSYFELWGFNFTHKSVGVKGLCDIKKGSASTEEAISLANKAKIKLSTKCFGKKVHNKGHFG